MKKAKNAVKTAEDYRELLLAKRAELLSEAGESGPNAAELAGVAEEDQAPLLHDEFVALQLQRLDHVILKQIDAALRRVDEGSFGVCGSCEGAISAKRLAAIPWAGLCIRCQERLGSVGIADNEQAA